MLALGELKIDVLRLLAFAVKDDLITRLNVEDYKNPLYYCSLHPTSVKFAKFSSCVRTKKEKEKSLEKEVTARTKGKILEGKLASVNAVTVQRRCTAAAAAVDEGKIDASPTIVAERCRSRLSCAESEEPPRNCADVARLLHRIFTREEVPDEP
ncbi:hypothetical protein K0M31_020022 [Melipona bicolor]|uniref:Uncharacterized protein n=1 Tax=Melipona bicolor TaxID=60889 RepID=A0AA40G0M5_9HYME|nr:hypothetical protein K0M31_020022 [Melipona bicolor]